MNPHFINNFLSNITQLQVEGKNEDVKKCLSKFAELVNLILKSTKSNLITLEEELHISRLYLELQKVRFKNKLNYEILLTGFSSEEIEYVMVPPMILQPILENCIKHGFRDETRNSHISIAISGHLNKRFKCTIRDNGKGLENLAGTSNHNGISLKNINDRLNLIDDSQERLVNIEEVRDDFNKLVGTEVTLMIPLISILS